jgi:hypothetical protein
MHTHTLTLTHTHTHLCPPQVLDSDESGGLSCTEFCNAIKKLVLTKKIYGFHFTPLVFSCTARSHI